MVIHHDFHVTIFVVASDHASTSLFKSPTQNNLDIVALPSVDILGLIDPNADLAAKLLVFIRESLPSLRNSIAAMKFRPTALVVDLFGAEAFAIADEFGMLKYMFETTTTWFLAVRFDGFQLMGIDMANIDGILINTWEDLKPSTIQALRDNKYLGRIVKVPIYPIGPLGLEQSQQRFIWVVHPPSDNALGTYFTIGKNNWDDTSDYLLEGFFHSNQRHWPESITNGVPMIACPLYAEQKMNAAMLTEDFGIAVRPKASLSEEIIGRVEIEKMVKKIMVDKDGIVMSNKVKEWNNNAENALSKGGSSYNSLSQVAKDCLRHLRAKRLGCLINLVNACLSLLIKSLRFDFCQT
ncbi:hypothetical protein REPUB_Repub10bG0158600 [Reevesia pubescens]